MDASSASITGKVVGAIAGVCAVLGIAATVATVAKFVRGKAEELTTSLPLFAKLFFTFSVVSVLFNLVLVFVACALLLGVSLNWWQFLAVFIPQVAYVFALGVLWRHPRLGQSIAAATGCGNAGLAIPFLALVPLWGPIALWLAN